MAEVKLDDVLVKVQAAGENKDDEDAQAEAKNIIKTFNKEQTAATKREIEESKNDAEAHGASEKELEKLEKELKKEKKGEAKDDRDQINAALEDAGLEKQQ